MSCKHGVWHESDCDICASENKLQDEIAELKRQLENRTRHRNKAEAYVVSLSQQLAESQAREARLVDYLRTIADLRNMGRITPEVVAFEALALPHDDTALKEYHDSIVEKCAVIAGNSCLVPPDGGSPTLEEAAVSEEAARRIRKLKGAA